MKTLNTKINRRFLVSVALATLTACSAERIFDFDSDPVRDPKSCGHCDAASLTIGRSNYDFLDTPVGQSSSVSLTITNVGKSEARDISAVGSLSAPFQYLGGAHPGIGGTCARDLMPGESCTLVLEFIPSESGSFSDRLEIYYADGSNTTSTSLKLKGTGVFSETQMSRQEITVNLSDEEIDAEDSPTLIKIDTQSVDFFQLETSPENIHFVDSDRETVLEHEVEGSDDDGNLWVWVKVLHSDTRIKKAAVYLYY